MISRNIITNLAAEVGFDLVGVVRAEALDDEHNRFKEWLLAGNSSTLSNATSKNASMQAFLSRAHEALWFVLFRTFRHIAGATLTIVARRLHRMP